MNNQCDICGSPFEGDGYTTVLHCPDVENIEGYEPDASPLLCSINLASVRYELNVNEQIAITKAVYTYLKNNDDPILQRAIDKFHHNFLNGGN